MDCRPLKELLEREMASEGGSITGIESLMEKTALRAVLLSTSSYPTGE